MKLDKKNTVGFIDIGTTKISVIICAFARDNTPSFLGYSEVETAGFKNGEITNYNQFIASFNSALEIAETNANINISDVVISLSGLKYKSHFFQSKLDFAFETSITKHHIKDCAEAIIFPDTFDKATEKIIHINPVNFIVDNNNFVDNPEGVFAKSLGATYQIITVNSSSIENLVSVFSGLSLNVKKVVANSYASAISTLIPDEKDLGSLVIDIGASSMYLALFFNGKFMFNTSLPLGSNMLNYHLMHNLNITYPEAERLKKQYGVTHPEGIDFSKDIHLSIIDDNGMPDTDSMKKSDLLSLTNSAMVSIVENIKSKFPSDVLSNIHKVVLTGGGAKTIGISKIFSDIFNCSVRIANPLTINIFGDKFNNPQYATLVGLFVDYTDSLSHPIGKAKDIEKQNILKRIKLLFNKYFG